MTKTKPRQDLKDQENVDKILFKSKSIYFYKPTLRARPKWSRL